LIPRRANQLAQVAGHEQPDYYAYLREILAKNMFHARRKLQSFEPFWSAPCKMALVVLLYHAAAEPKFHGDWKPP